MSGGKQELRTAHLMCLRTEICGVPVLGVPLATAGEAILLRRNECSGRASADEEVCGGCTLA